MHEPSFLFSTCQRGAEEALKREVAARRPGWRFAYSRPGFVTFKLPDPADAPPTEQFVFARNWSLSLAQLSGDRLGNVVHQVWNLPAVEVLLTQQPVHDLHVWQRDTAAPGLHGYEPGETPLAWEVERALRAAAPVQLQFPPDVPQPRRATPRNQRVLDVVIVEPDQWWIGWHRATSGTLRWPGGVIPVSCPAHAVSRAYLKIEEALAWSRLPLEAGDRCAEIGCAPGGASQALLDHGLRVLGIDPAEVASDVRAHLGFQHIRKRGKEVRRRELAGVRWLVADMNVAPQYTLDTVEDIVSHPAVSIRGMILTLKLPQWELADELSQYIGRVHGWGYRDVRVRQLVHGAQEVCLVALRSKRLRRLRRGRGRHQVVDLSKTMSIVVEPDAQHRADPPHNLPPPPHV